MRIRMCMCTRCRDNIGIHIRNMNHVRSRIRRRVRKRMRVRIIKRIRVGRFMCIDL